MKNRNSYRRIDKGGALFGLRSKFVAELVCEDVACKLQLRQVAAPLGSKNDAGGRFPDLPATLPAH
jgi:hypothetical protein